MKGLPISPRPVGRVSTSTNLTLSSSGRSDMRITLVVVEVRLLHGAVPDRDALMQHAGQAVEDAALHVRLRGGRLHDHAAVDRHPHLVHADLAARTVERDLDCARAE